MSHKRKQRKGRLDTGSGGSQATSTGIASQAEGADSADRGGSWLANAKNSVAGGEPKGIRLEADARGGNNAPPGKSAQRAAEAKSREQQAVADSLNDLSKKDDSPSAKSEHASGSSGNSSGSSGDDESSGGVIGKIGRWWRGPSPLTVRVPSNPPGSATPERIPTPPSSIEPPRAARPFASPSAPPPANPAITQPTLPSGSGAERVHAALRLGQVEQELDETKRALQVEREKSHARIRDLESERDQARDELNRSFSGKGESEGHISVLRRSVAALERQLQEEHEAAEKNAEDSGRKIHALEEALQNARSPVQQLRGELEDSHSQRERLDSLVERYKSELDAAQRRIPELQEELDAAQGRLGQMESELARRSGVSDSAIMERARIEERAGLVQKALDVMEQQLREEREASSKQIQQLEGERDQARAKAAQLETRVATLLRDLDSAKIQARSKKKGQPADAESDEGALLTTRSAGRLSSLEGDLGSSAPLASADKHAAATRISRLESRWEELKARLLPKDHEITELRQQAEQHHSKIQEHRAEIEQQQTEIQRLEAALAEAQQPVPLPGAAAPSGVVPGTPSASGVMALSTDIVLTLYTQSMSKLTVLMASADILMMNPKLETNAKESLQEMKNEGQALLDLIKSYTIPPDAPKSH